MAAVVDAVRRDAAPTPARTELERRAELGARLEQLGARGELVLYGERCRVRRLELPWLEWTGDDRSGCGAQGALSPDGSTIARCLDDETEVLEAGGSGVAYTVRGCAPAWRPDGTLTVSQGRAVTRACPVGVACRSGTLIPRAELERAARRHPTVPDVPVRLRALVDSVAWLSTRHAAVLLSIRFGGRLDSLGPLSTIAFFEDGRETSARPYLRAAGGQLGSSPRGTYVSLTPDVILRADGTQVSLPQHLRGARDFAWSPNERFVALATRFAVVVVHVGSLERFDESGGGLRSVTVPLQAARLDWR